MMENVDPETSQAGTPITVGYVDGGYKSSRNFSGAQAEGIRFRRYRGLQKAVSYPNYKTVRSRVKCFKFFDTIHCPGLSLGERPDLYHFFDRLSVGRTPWVVTFSTAVPRWDTSSSFGWRLLSREACGGMIAISENARQIQLAAAEAAGCREAIEGKLTVLHPPQPISQSVKEKVRERPSVLRFVFVGADFFRKGGLETLRVFDHLASEGCRFELTIVSSLKIGDYASQAGSRELSEATALIEKNKNVITWHHRLPNDRVMECFRTADVGLLPTYADAYGYSVLEAQAHGCPTITTNVRALPEINDTQNGWMIDVPKDVRGEALYRTTGERSILSETIYAQLLEHVRDILDDPQIAAVKGQAAFQRIIRDHCPIAHGQRLAEIYRRILP